MYARYRNAVAAHFRLDRFEQSRSDTFVFFRRLYVQPMYKRFVRCFDPRISAAADHPVAVIHRDPEPIPTVKVMLFDIEQILIDPRKSPERVLGLQNHEDHIVSVFVFVYFYFHNHLTWSHAPA